jgi:glycosyltransferase involved in cell wall biosynthesis
MEGPVTTMRRLNVLAVAAAAHPLQGSEPGLGWNWVRALSRYHDLWVIAGEQDGNREAIHDYFTEHPEAREHLHVTFIPCLEPPPLVRLWPPLSYHYYRLWHEKAFEEARKLSREVPFDLAHQVNMIGYREPGYLWRLALPFVWGPIGGHDQMPWRFLPILGFRDVCFYTCRNLLNAYQMRTHRRVRRAMHAARALVAATSQDQRAILRFHHRQAVVLADAGPSSAVDSVCASTIHPRDTLHICWCGVFVGRKGLPLALQAIQRASAHVALTLHIIGDGAEGKRWRQLAARLGVGHLCRWHGRVPRAEALRIIRASDMMLISSLQDATSTVVFEALEYGKPVICHDTCGFGDIVDASCGVKIPVQSPRQSIRQFGDALLRLARDRAWLAALSHGAVQRMRVYTWDYKARQMSQIYRAVLDGRSTDPRT